MVREHFAFECLFECCRQGDVCVGIVVASSVKIGLIYRCRKACLGTEPALSDSDTDSPGSKSSMDVFFCIICRILMFCVVLCGVLLWPLHNHRDVSCVNSKNNVLYEHAPTIATARMSGRLIYEHIVLPCKWFEDHRSAPR